MTYTCVANLRSTVLGLKCTSTVDPDTAQSGEQVEQRACLMAPASFKYLPKAPSPIPGVNFYAGRYHVQSALARMYIERVLMVRLCAPTQCTRRA